MPEQIESITALVPEEVVKTVCEPLAGKQSPTCAYEAQLSIPYLIAVALVRHNFSLRDLEIAPLSDTVVSDLSKKVDYEANPNPKYYSGEVRIKLKDGRILQQRESKNRGCADIPLSNHEITNKSMSNCTMAISKEKAQIIEDTILNLHDYKSAEEFTQAF